MALISERKRQTAYKLRVGDLFIGKPIVDQDKFLFLEIGDKKISRVNIVGVIIEKFESELEKKYMFITLDDGSGQVRIKIFGDDVLKFNGFSQGQTVVVIGVLRYWNEELYIIPEIIREVNPKYLLLRKLELEKKFVEVPKEKIFVLKDKILEIIKNSEDKNGIEMNELLEIFSEFPSDIVNQEIQKLIEEGIIFEPRPNRLRWLG
jgi:RPA family protein